MIGCTLVIAALLAALAYTFWKRADLHRELANLNQLVSDMLLAPTREEQERLALEALRRKKR